MIIIFKIKIVQIQGGLKRYRQKRNWNTGEQRGYAGKIL